MTLASEIRGLARFPHAPHAAQIFGEDANPRGTLPLDLKVEGVLPEGLNWLETPNMRRRHVHEPKRDHYPDEANIPPQPSLGGGSGSGASAAPAQTEIGAGLKAMAEAMATTAAGGADGAASSAPVSKDTALWATLDAFLLPKAGALWKKVGKPLMKEMKGAGDVTANDARPVQEAFITLAHLEGESKKEMVRWLGASLPQKGEPVSDANAPVADTFFLQWCTKGLTDKDACLPPRVGSVRIHHSHCGCTSCAADADPFDLSPDTPPNS